MICALKDLEFWVCKVRNKLPLESETSLRILMCHKRPQPRQCAWTTLSSPPCTPQVSRGGEASGRWRIHHCLPSGRHPFWCAACWLSEPSGYERISDWAHPSWCPALWAQSQRDSLGAGRHQHSSAKLEHVWMVPASSRVKNVHESLNRMHLVGCRSPVWLAAGVCPSYSPPKTSCLCTKRIISRKHAIGHRNIT